MAALQPRKTPCGLPAAAAMPVQGHKLLTVRCCLTQSYAAITEAMQNGHAGKPGVDADGEIDMAPAPRAGACGAAESGEDSGGSGEGYREAEREPEGGDLPDANGGFGGGVLGLAVPRQARTSKREPRQKQARFTQQTGRGLTYMRAWALQHMAYSFVEVQFTLVTPCCR